MTYFPYTHRAEKVLRLENRNKTSKQYWLFRYIKSIGDTGPNLDLLCILQSDAAPFVKIMQSFNLMQNTQKGGSTGGGEIFWCPSF